VPGEGVEGVEVSVSTRDRCARSFKYAAWSSAIQMQGCRVLVRFPAQCIIPSSEEGREDGAMPRCGGGCWVRGSGGAFGSSERQQGDRLTRRDVWHRPEVRAMLRCGRGLVLMGPNGKHARAPPILR
jgi:hypothetical protein